MTDTPVATLLNDVYQRLSTAYGPQHWWPGDTPFQVMVGAILTQNTAWTNVERAIANLKAAGLLTPSALRDVPVDELAALIRPSGYFNMKARKLRALGAFLAQHDDDLDAFFASRPLPDLRAALLAVYGVGEETADSMLLYAGNLPSFVVDAYTVRVLKRLGVLTPDSRATYAGVQALFHESLPADPALYNEFHALFVTHGKDTCRARAPLCGDCPLRPVCETGQGVGGAQAVANRG